jgi:hypothetical protein
MAAKPISRRQVLKILMAGGAGLGAASFLPEKWLKPMVQSGVLPAHAATSGSTKRYIKGFRATDPTGNSYPAIVAAVSSSPFSKTTSESQAQCDDPSDWQASPYCPDPVAGVWVTVYETDPSLVQWKTPLKTGSNGYTGIWYFEDRYQGAEVKFTLPDGTFAFMCIPS